MKESRIARLLRWRKKNAALYAKKWSEAVASSEKIKEAARRVALAYKEKAQATKRQMPQFQKGEAHVRAIIWRLRSPSNRVYEFKNLAEFLRQHSDLFAPDDVRWHRVKTAETCRAYKGLAALRPYLADGTPRRRVEGSWKGWRWVASDGECHFIACFEAGAKTSTAFFARWFNAHTSEEIDSVITHWMELPEVPE